MNSKNKPWAKGMGVCRKVEPAQSLEHGLSGVFSVSLPIQKDKRTSFSTTNTQLRAPMTSKCEMSPESGISAPDELLP
jgi:hypothetical protein